MSTLYDVVIVGGGHNGLVASCYLARAGKKVLLLEKRPELGGATTSVKAFDGVDAKLSRYSYLVALLPDQIVSELELTFETLSRSVSSYTPYVRESSDGTKSHDGVLINRLFDVDSRESITKVSKNDRETQAWVDFYEKVGEFARVVAPTFLGPLPTSEEMRTLLRSALGEVISESCWSDLVTQPLSKCLEKYFTNDIIKGIVLTDGLIGTFASADEFASNICFLYHLVGNGTGEWKVPRGGMGALVNELERRALELGVEIRTSAEVSRVTTHADGATVKVRNGEEFESRLILAGCSPHILEQISEIKAPPLREGCQLKINMILNKLPELKSGIDPHLAFGGTFHINESYSQLERALIQAKRGEIPDLIPAEMYCHTITDPSILSEELKQRGVHTLTLFALHLPASLFHKDHEKVKAEVVRRTLEGLNEYLVRPIQDYVAVDEHGNPCVEAKTPLELESEIDLPQGNIFHGDLQFPWKEPSDQRRWGVETTNPRIFLAGSSAQRGGGVSGIAGHNAAMAALESLAKLQ